ncbi:galactoside 2-alpha-L-fucosyltransferase-like protein [Cinnamomum micranthum f. kanehirae]|uniref:Fucosyltransferase n=1 Tax=Cinnamomum micranthum f. kanehirae TaxID=337451 RepID=A0A443NIN4_9MAGN|nr:galactoside 2-alpha-L-fucosyltransferase-like protein [Cinnamomum micranthum f. kanehirae]
MLLTERVLLVDKGVDMGDLFCEPFPDNSWSLPHDFPLNQLNEKSPRSYGNMLKNKLINQNMNSGSAGLLPVYVLFYQAYLVNAKERIGIQIRVFDTGTGPFQYVLDQILACALNEILLPNVTLEAVASTMSQRAKAVLITSLSSGYYENIRNMYWEHPTVSGEIVSVYQPSHEEYQQTEKQMHNVKAWAEMYLLSLTDLLVTSLSTFGNVAQGLGGLKALDPIQA